MIGKVPVVCQYLAVAAVALVCYVQTARYDFVYDDALQIVLNPRIRSFSNVGAAFTENFWGFISPHSTSNYFRPLQTIIYMTAYALGGLWPAPYHWINIVMHVFASLAVLWLGLLLLSNLKASIWGASLFAAHPMHTENVAWIAGITDIGCGLFFFLSLGAYIRALQLQPSNAAAHINLGNVLQLRNDPAGAEREFRLAVEFDPKLATSRVSLGMLLVRTGHISEAVSLFKEALVIDPRNEQAREFLKQLGSEHAP